MTNLKQALQWLIEGKKIRGIDWDDGCYLMLNRKGIVREYGDVDNAGIEECEYEIYSETERVVLHRGDEAVSFDCPHCNREYMIELDEEGNDGELSRLIYCPCCGGII